MTREQIARDMILRMVANFPCLYHDELEQDHECEVNGGDLVEWVSNEIHAMKPDLELQERAEQGSPARCDEDGHCPHQEEACIFCVD